MKRNERLQTAVDRLASLTEGGHLLASTDPATLINTVVDKYLELRAKAAKWDSYQAELANEKTHTDRFISLMDAEEDELRRDAEKWNRLMELFDTSCDKCFLGHVCGTHRRPEAVCEDIKDVMSEVKDA
jgi:hypothetical protein